jgi:hypothetical protein
LDARSNRRCEVYREVSYEVADIPGVGREYRARLDGNLAIIRSKVKCMACTAILEAIFSAVCRGDYEGAKALADYRPVACPPEKCKAAANEKHGVGRKFGGEFDFS